MYYADSYAEECIGYQLGCYPLYISKNIFNELEMTLKLNVSLFPPPSLPHPLPTPSSSETGFQYLALAVMEVTK